MKSTSRQSIDRSLFAYGGMITLIITVVSYLNIHTTGGLVTFILFVPLCLYFLTMALAYANYQFHHFLNTNQPNYRYFGRFSLKDFLDQSEISFLITKLLFATALAILFFRLSLQILHEV